MYSWNSKCNMFHNFNPMLFPMPEKYGNINLIHFSYELVGIVLILIALQMLDM